MEERREKGLTLVELIITIVLLSVVILAATTFDYSSIYMFESSRKKAILVNEMSLIFEHIARYAVAATGDIANPGIVVGTKSATESYVMLRIDSNKTPDDYTDDTWVRYEVDHATGSERVYSGSFQEYHIRFCSDWRITPPKCNSSWERLTTRVIPDDNGNYPTFSLTSPNVFSLSNVVLLYDPDQTPFPRHVRRNPDLYLTDPVTFNSVSCSIN